MRQRYRPNRVRSPPWPQGGDQFARLAHSFHNLVVKGTLRSSSRVCLLHTNELVALRESREFQAVLAKGVRSGQDGRSLGIGYCRAICDFKNRPLRRIKLRAFSRNLVKWIDHQRHQLVEIDRALQPEHALDHKIHQLAMTMASKEVKQTARFGIVPGQYIHAVNSHLGRVSSL